MAIVGLDLSEITGSKRLFVVRIRMERYYYFII